MASGEWVNERTHGQQFEAWFLRRATMAARRGGGGPAFPGADALRAARARGGCGGQIESTAVVYTIALAALAQPVLAAAQQQPRAYYRSPERLPRLARPNFPRGEQGRLTHRTAVYGPVCTVVWEGEAVRPTPIPIVTGRRPGMELHCAV